MPFKKNDDGSLVLTESGLPIFVGPDGSEKPYDPDQKAKQIAELTEKAGKRGKEIEAAQAKLALLGDVEDIEAFVSQAKANAETVASLADKERDTEAAVQKRINEAVKAAVTPVATERDTLKAANAQKDTELLKATVGNAFLNSKYAKENFKNPALAERLLGGDFVLKDGQLVGLDESGDVIYGANGVADFDEVLHVRATASQFRDDLLKPPAGGSGTQNASGGARQPNNNLSSVQKIAEGLKKGNF